jgi:hypothetical protein
MSRSILIYGAILVAAMGASWVHYTDDSAKPKEGTVLIDAKATELEKIVYHTADLDVTFEIRNDAFGKFPWTTVVEQKKKKVDGNETTETKTTRFKAGSAADKLIEGFTPLMAVRELDKVDDATAKAFGLATPDTTVTVSVGGHTTTLDLGGETYGTKDRYVRNRETGRVYVVDDEPFKTLKFASTRLPERSLIAEKTEEIDSFTLQEGASSVQWAHKNKADTQAAYWERAGGSGKDETFANWLDKLMKLKSTSYLQDGEAPTDLQSKFDVIVREDGKPTETLHISESGEDWYATSDSTRGLVKLTKGPAKDVAEDVSDILEGKTPPPDPTPPAKPDKPPGQLLTHQVIPKPGDLPEHPEKADTTGAAPKPGAAVKPDAGKPGADKAAPAPKPGAKPDGKK